MPILERYLRACEWVSEFIRSRCIEVAYYQIRSEGFSEEGLELVYALWHMNVLLYAKPGKARFFRLWDGGRLGYAPLILLRRLGFIRVHIPGHQFGSRWSYPFRPVDLRGYATPFELRVLGYVQRYRRRRELKSYP